MGKFILTEEEKSYIQSLYNLNEQTENRSVEDIQKLLHKMGYGKECGPVDGKYGSKTANAITLYLKDKKAGTLRVQSSGTASDSTTPEDKEMERVALEKEKSTAEDLEKDLEQLKDAISKQPTKEKCIELIASAKAGIKVGAKLTDTSTLGQCFNSYNFIGDGSSKVKRHYNLKGKGN